LRMPGPAGRVATLVWDAWFSLVTIWLAGFGRAAAEVGAVMNRRGKHRRLHARDDANDRARDLQGKPFAGDQPGADPHDPPKDLASNATNHVQSLRPDRTEVGSGSGVAER